MTARHPRSTRPRPPASGAEARLEILEMGAKGDAVAAWEEGPVYVPFALPGEVVRARVLGDRADGLTVETASPERVSPPCAHFGRCGGCQLQHWAEAPYLAWKRDLVVRALARRGLEAEVAEIVPAWGRGRRRAAFHAERTPRGVRLGFIERGGARIEPVAACPVLTPALAAAIPKLALLAELFAPQRGAMTLHVLATDTGLDLALKGAGRVAGLDRGKLEEAAALADRLDLARLALDGETLVARRSPVVAIGRARVIPPPGAFLQATAEGEAALARLVLEATEGASRIADLFSGIGTFALRLAERGEVHAVEGEADMIAALRAAADGATGLKPIAAERRDLMRAALTAAELKRFDAVVFDPPRAGARLQAEQIGASKAGVVVAVSCDPGTFARDVRTLVDAGFRLTRVTPIDQFRWSPHVEIVGVLER